MPTPTLPDADPLTGDERITVRQAGRVRGLTLAVYRDWLMGLVQTAIGAALSPVTTRLSALETGATSQSARIAMLEGKPEEAAHFIGSAAVPAVSILGGGTVTLINLTPARVGDVLRTGEEIMVRPAVALPNGLGIAAARVTADNTVVVQLVTSIAISAGASITWNITALR